MRLLKRIDYQWSFMLLFVLIGIAFVILNLGVLYYHWHQLQDSLNREKAYTTFSMKQDLVKHDFNRFEKLIVTMTQSRDFKNYLLQPNQENAKRVNTIFSILASSHPDVLQVRYIDSLGQEQIRVERLNDDTVRVSDETMQNKSKRDYFKHASANNEGDIYISSIDLNLEHGKIEIPYKPIVRFALPVFSEGKRSGIVVVNILMPHILQELTHSSSFFLYLYDEEGYLLVSNDNRTHHWSRYIGPKHTYRSDQFFFKRQLHFPGLPQKIYLGMIPKESLPLSPETISQTLLLLIGFIIPIGFLLAYLLAQIPKRLFDEIEERERLMLQQSKMAAIGEMIGAITHQWRQPLNAVGVLAQEIGLRCEYGNLGKEELKSLNNELQSYLEYMSGTIDDFRNFYKPINHKGKFDVLNAIKSSLSIVETQLENYGITYQINDHCKTKECRYETDGYESEFKQVIISMINNAREAIIEAVAANPEKRKEITIDIEEESAGIRIRIHDTGGGIHEKVAQSLFDLYVSTKYEQQGTGLGLYMSRLIIEQHMLGQLRAYNDSEGAVFEIFLPTEQRE